jgi:F420H(2)-dependent quinone reductase
VALDPLLARQSMCYLQTTGRVTRLPRVVEIWFAADPVRDRIYILSGGRDDAHWVRNARRDPAVRVRIGGSTFSGRVSLGRSAPGVASRSRWRSTSTSVRSGDVPERPRP